MSDVLRDKERGERERERRWQSSITSLDGSYSADLDVDSARRLLVNLLVPMYRLRATDLIPTVNYSRKFVFSWKTDIRIARRHLNTYYDSSRLWRNHTIFRPLAFNLPMKLLTIKFSQRDWISLQDYYLQNHVACVNLFPFLNSEKEKSGCQVSLLFDLYTPHCECVVSRWRILFVQRVCFFFFLFFFSARMMGMHEGRGRQQVGRERKLGWGEKRVRQCWKEREKIEDECDTLSTFPLLAGNYFIAVSLRVEVEKVEVERGIFIALLASTWYHG